MYDNEKFENDSNSYIFFLFFDNNILQYFKLILNLYEALSIGNLATLLSLMFIVLYCVIIKIFFVVFIAVFFSNKNYVNCVETIYVYFFGNNI